MLPEPEQAQQYMHCEFWGFHSKLAENFDFLEYDVTSLANWILIF